MPRRRVAVHQGLGEREVVRVTTFDRIRRQRERRAGESNQRHSASQLALDQANGVEREGERFARIDRPHPVDILGRPNRALDGRALALDEVERDAHRLERQEQVGKQDGGVDLDATQGLQGDFGREIRRAAQLQKGVFLAEGAVFRHVAAGLPHEPDRCLVDGFTPARAQKPALAYVMRRHQELSSCVLYYRVCFEPGGPVSPILVRPVREQFEHDRVIRVLQARYKRKFEVAINPGPEQNVSVEVGAIAMYPDLLLFSQERGRKLQGTIEVETVESINTLEAMAEWAPLSRLRAPFYLYVPPNTVDTVRRLCASTTNRRRRNLDLPHGRRPDSLHDGASVGRRGCIEQQPLLAQAGALRAQA